MDTISRENNTSMLPIGGIIVGVVALLLAGYAAFTLSKVNKTVAAQEEKIAKIDSIESQIVTAASDAAKANKSIGDYVRQTQGGFDTVGNELAKLREEITKMQDTRKPAAAAAKKGASNEPVVAGPDEYVIKPGDTFSKIAAAQGVKLSDIVAVNPGVDSSKLHLGQKIKLPKK